eukprot:1155311-Pelagomonas_calceolata.AAC.5
MVNLLSSEILGLFANCLPGKMCGHCWQHHPAGQSVAVACNHIVKHLSSMHQACAVVFIVLD